ncbi:MAG: phage tail protein [Phaeospirillum sp.]|nr:phage tail protein [Phaeospirillum sp.]
MRFFEGAAGVVFQRSDALKLNGWPSWIPCGKGAAIPSTQCSTPGKALTRIARCGRAVPIQQGGIVRIIRDDAPQTMPVAMCGPRNIVKGSFKIKDVMPGDDTADAVTVEYFSSRTRKPDETTAKLPDSNGDNPAKVNPFGCTAKDHVRLGFAVGGAPYRHRGRAGGWRAEKRKGRRSP